MKCEDCMREETDICPKNNGATINDDICDEYLDFEMYWDRLDGIEKEEYMKEVNE